MCLHTKVIDTMFCTLERWGPWVWLYYVKEMRRVFEDIPALDVVKMYDFRLFW